MLFASIDAENSKNIPCMCEKKPYFNLVLFRRAGNAVTKRHVPLALLESYSSSLLPH